MLNKPYRPLWLLLALLLGNLLGSCRPPSPMPTEPSPLTKAGYWDYAGAIHVHTLYSPGGRESLEEIAHAAAERNLSYLIITDHNTLVGLRAEGEGWRKGVLVLIGSEVSTSYGHCLTMGLKNFWGQEKTQGRVSAEELFSLVHEQGGLAFIAHPHHPNSPWSRWEVSGYTGIEIYNLQVNLRERNVLGYLESVFLAPFKFRLNFGTLLRRPEDNLRIWDGLLQEGKKVVGVGSVDVHGRVSLLGWTIDSYSRFFRLVQTRILSREKFNGELEHDRTLVYEALRQGHAYISFGIWGDPYGFSYLALGKKGFQGTMGDRVDWDPYCCRVRITVAQKAIIRLLRNGEEIGKREGRDFDTEINQPGSYRVEVYKRKGLRRRLWVLSNPIYFVRRGGTNGEGP